MISNLKAVFSLAILASASTFASPPADAPSGSMGMCNDGSYSSSAEKKGACKGHKGVMPRTFSISHFES